MKHLPFREYVLNFSNHLPPKRNMLQWKMGRLQDEFPLKQGNFPLNHNSGRKGKNSRIELVSVPALCQKRTMLNIKPQQHLIKKKSRILFYVHASMPPLRKPKRRMAARMNWWKMMFHHEIVKPKTGGSFPVILAFCG